MIEIRRISGGDYLDFEVAVRERERLVTASRFLLKRASGSRPGSIRRNAVLRLLSVSCSTESQMSRFLEASMWR
jgi:hypothetical protein